MERDLTSGNITKTMLSFACPMILGNLLQQCYNIADTLIVGKFLGKEALAAVGSAYTLMTFLTSIIIGLCMGSGTVFSVCFGKNDCQQMKNSIAASFLFIAVVSAVINILAFANTDFILRILHVPTDIYGIMREYVRIIFFGIFFTFLYNYFAFMLRAVGDSVVPLCFLGAAAALNIALDILFVVVFNMGAGSAAAATVIAQAASGIGISAYVLFKKPELCPNRDNFKITKKTALEVIRHSCAACIQQSVMNFGILMIQGLVNSFGSTIIAAFGAAVKIDSFAYMPAQEFGNAFSIFISQNHGSRKPGRVSAGTRKAVIISASFCLAVSLLVFISAPYLMRIFVNASESGIIQNGVEYLRIEGSFYFAIGILFLLYGFYRGIEKPEMSLILTVISLGTRVLLAYLLAPIKTVGTLGIWWAVPIGWILADITGLLCLRPIKAKQERTDKIKKPDKIELSSRRDRI